MTKERNDFFSKELADELRRVEDYIRHEPTIEKKIYYFSAAYGMTSKCLRFSFSKEVLLADFIFTQVYNLLLQRLQQIKSGDLMIQIPSTHFDQICKILRVLADKFESNDNNIQSELQDLLTIGFITTGAGNYLAEKGDLET